MGDHHIRIRIYKISLIVVVSAIIIFLFINRQTDDNQQVYLAVLAKLSTKAPLKEFSFYSHPSNCRGAKQDNLPEVSTILFDAFYGINDVQSREPGVFNVPGTEFNIVSEKDSLLIYAGKTPVLKDMPKQLINISRIGFAHNNTQALVCVESQESGDLVYLKFIDNRWQVVKWTYIW